VLYFGLLSAFFVGQKVLSNEERYVDLFWICWRKMSQNGKIDGGAPLKLEFGPKT
jgi:hypothetical protein